MKEYLPVNSTTKEPLWTEKGGNYIIPINSAAFIRIAKPRKNAKSVCVELVQDFSVIKKTVEKKDFKNLSDYCREFFVLVKKAKGAKVRQVTIDTPDKGKFFISEPTTGFQWI